MDVLVLTAENAGVRAQALVKMLRRNLARNRFAVRAVAFDELSAGPWEKSTSLLVIDGSVGPPSEPRAPMVRRVSRFCESGGRLWAVEAGGGGTAWVPSAMDGCVVTPVRFTSLVLNGQRLGCTGDGITFGEGWPDPAATTTLVKASPSEEPVTVGARVHAGLVTGVGDDTREREADMAAGSVVVHGLVPGSLVPPAVDDAVTRTILEYLALPTSERGEGDVKGRCSTNEGGRDVDGATPTLSKALDLLAAPPALESLLRCLGSTDDMPLEVKTRPERLRFIVVPGSQNEGNTGRGDVMTDGELPVRCHPAGAPPPQGHAGVITDPGEQDFSLQEYERALTTKHLGRWFLHGEVLRSTQRLLDENWNFACKLPEGFTVGATQQVAARGRGQNVWVSPRGQAMFSVVLHHPLHGRPLAFLQYIAALSVVYAFRTLPGYADLDLRIKWPNDVYVGGRNTVDGSVKKIAGVLITTTIEKGSFVVVLGIGLNVANDRPSSCVNEAIRIHNERVAIEEPSRASLPPIRVDRAVALCLNALEPMLERFRRVGFNGLGGRGSSLAELYRRWWLHEGQTVTIEGERGQFRLEGIDDEGYLRASSQDPSGATQPRVVSLEPDGNSFDMVAGLLKRKR